MKNLVLSALVILMSAAAYAQTSATEVKPSTYQFNRNEGVKIGIVKSFFDLKTKVSATNGFESISESEKTDADQKIGFLVGYQNVIPYSAGYNVQLVYNTFDESVESLRLEGNLVYGINNQTHILGGLNMQKLLDVDDENIDSELGFQLGVGANIQNFNMSLMYYTIKHSTSGAIEDISYSADLDLTGFELALGTTF